MRAARMAWMAVWLSTALGSAGGTPLVPHQRDRKENLAEHFRKWLEEDVVYIISQEEKDVFRRLANDEERDHFIEQFWQRRDPSPTTSQNEFKEEHYRRIQFAIERFSSGIPGWKTDRGIIYIKFGEPDSLRRNPTGGHYNRPYWEGGGSTSVFPFEIWRYREIPGIGQDIELEFVDTTLSGAYQLTINPDEKDALLRIAGAGLTDAERRGLSSKLDRIVRKTSPSPGNNPILVGYGRTKDQPFEKLQLLTAIQKPPDFKERKLEAFIRTKVRYATFPVLVDTYSIPISEEAGEARVGIGISNSALTFQAAGGIAEARVELLGRVTTLTDEIAAEFSDLVRAQVRPEDLKANRISMFQKKLQLKPGRYKLEMVAADQGSDRIGTVETSIIVPRLEKSRLDVNPVVMARQIQILPPAPAGPEEDPFRLGKVRLLPSLDREFQSDEIPVYFKVYNAAPDASTGRGLVRITYRIEQGGKLVTEESEKVSPKPEADGTFAMVKVLPGMAFASGAYRLLLRIEDLIGRQVADRTVPFSVLRPN